MADMRVDSIRGHVCGPSSDRTRRSSPTTTSLGILATPVVGISSSVAFLGGQVDQAVLIAATMIIVGIGISTFSRSS